MLSPFAHMHLTPTEFRKTVCSHPRLLNILPPHFTVIDLPLPAGRQVWETWEPPEVKNVIRMALSRSTSRLFVQLDSRGRVVHLGFEEPADCSFFALCATGHDFSQPA
jgi:hypothetical protein